MVKIESTLARMGKRFSSRGVSSRVLDIPLSPIKEMELAASELENVVSLGQGIPSLKTPDHIVEAAREALADKKTAKYTLDPGTLELREAVCRKLSDYNGIRGLDAKKNVLVTVGASEALSCAMMSLVNPGDEVLVPFPTYPAHLELASLCGAKIVPVPLGGEKGYFLDPLEVEKRVSEKTKLLLLCSPHNPTGAVFGEKELRGVMDVLAASDAFVLTDETYEYLLYDGAKHFSVGSISEFSDRVVSCFSLSKTYSMTGWRVGYCSASEDLIDHMLKVHDCFAICAPAISQAAALAALKGPQDCVREMVAEYSKRRELMLSRLSELEGFSVEPPRGAYYVFPKTPGGDSYDFSIRLLREARVTTIPGAAFGDAGEGHVRLSFCGDSGTINEAFDRIEKWLS